MTTQEQAARPTVAVIGLGTMGTPMARNLLRAGCAVRAWNRSAASVEALAREGAVAARTARDAASGADVVVTMLSDAEAVVAVAQGEDGLLAGIGADAVWAQMSTIGVAGTERCARLAADRGVAFLDAPVSGSKGPAEAGKLVVLAGGDDAAIDRAAPVFDAVGSKTLRLGPIGAGTRFKLVVNAWLFYQMQGAAEIATFARATDVSLETFATFLEGSPLASPAALLKFKKLLASDYSPEFSLQWALKDLRLALGDAGTHGARMPAAHAIAEAWTACAEAGYGGDDVIGVVRGLAPRDVAAV